MTILDLRAARPEDRYFLQSLSPRLSGVPGPAWHDLAAMEGFQSRYMAATFAPSALDGWQTVLATITAFGVAAGGFAALITSQNLHRAWPRQWQRT